MEFHLLGPVEVTDKSKNFFESILPTAPKVRQVLSLLALRRNRIVQTSELIDELWESGPPVSAMTTLQTYVYKLRKMLNAHGPGGALMTRSGGYTLTIPDTSLDIHCFETEAAKGRVLLESGEATEAAEVLRSALAIWRGPALADVTLGKLLSSYVTGLDELRTRALEMRIDADLQLGRHRELISELKKLIHIDPLNEILHASLMTALHHSGRRYEALEIYQTLRGNMVKDLGMEPGKNLRKLHQALLSDSLPDTREVEEVTILTSKEKKGAATPPAGPTSSARPDPLPPGQLPSTVADFTGRSAILREARRQLVIEERANAEHSAMATIVIAGMPGVGKTALAVHMAHQLRDDFADGQLYACLGASAGCPKDPANVLCDFLRALGVSPQRMPMEHEERSKLFRSMTSRRRILIVLDDVDPATDVQSLLPGNPECISIITTRHRLHGLPGAWAFDLDVPQVHEATELLSRFIGLSRVEQERSAAEQLVNMYGNLPLALRCIGTRLARTPDLPLGSVVSELERSPRPLAELSIGDLNVSSRYDASYEKLTRLERATFRLLGMLPNVLLSIDDAAELLGWDTASAKKVLERLSDHHLVAIMHDAQDGSAHYRLPKTGWLYARDQLLSLLTENSGDSGTYDADKDLISSFIKY